MEFLLLLIIFLVLWAILTNYSVVHDIAKKKGYEHQRKIQLLSLIPVYGNLFVHKLPNLKPNVTKEEFDYLLSGEVIVKKIGLVFVILFVLSLILLPIALMLYVSFLNNFSRSLLLTFLVILLLLVHQGLVVEYASKKGYEGIEAGLMGLVPIYGFIHFMNRPKRRNTSKISIRATFSIKNILIKTLINAELTLLVVVVLVPVIYIFGMAFSPLNK